MADNATAERQPTDQIIVTAPPQTHFTFNSEHGHSLGRIQPMTRHAPESVFAWFNGFFQTIIAVSTLGASITFNYVISNTNIPPPGRYFGIDEVQTFLGISWLFFLLAMAFAALASTILTFFKEHWKRDWIGQDGKTSQTEVQLYATFATALLGSLLIAAFLFLCLVVVAYSPVVGWVALGFTSAFGLLIIGSVIFLQVPWPWRDNSPSKQQSPTQVMRPPQVKTA